MTEILKISSEIIEDGNFNKLNTLLSYPMTDDLAKTLRSIFFYLQDQKIFTIKYGPEWGQSNIDETVVEKFLNTKWSVFIRLLFQNQMFDQIYKCVENAVNCPPYVKLVQTAIDKGIELPVDRNYIKVLQISNIDFDKFIILLKRIPEIQESDKPEFSHFVQQQIARIQNEQQRLQFAKLINTHIVEKIDNPLILADFLQNNIDQGGLELKINSIQSMLILITRYHYNLDNFYSKLLQIIATQDSFTCASTSKLLKIIDVATKSSKVPLKILSQLIQSVLRQCMTQSCALQLWAVSLTFNIFKKHPSIKQYLQTGESQLNEIASYQDHWHPEIKRIVGYLQDDLSIFDYLNLNDLVELTDHQLLEAQF